MTTWRPRRGDSADRAGHFPITVWLGIRAQPHPRSALTWLRNPTSARYFSPSPTGPRPPAHGAFDDHRSPRSGMHLRELFLEHRLLPPIGRTLAELTD
jgi:hypothetical protein